MTLIKVKAMGRHGVTEEEKGAWIFQGRVWTLHTELS